MTNTNHAGKGLPTKNNRRSGVTGTALHRVRTPHQAGPPIKRTALLSELVDIGLIVAGVLLIAAIAKVVLEDLLPPPPVVANHPIALSTPSDQPPSPPPTATSTPTPRPTHTRLPTLTPRPTAPPSATPTATLAPLRGYYPPTVTPSYYRFVSTSTITHVYVPPPAPLIEFPAGTVNIVLMGSDKRPDESGWRTDTLIVASVNPNIPSVTMLSVPRDLWVFIPGWTYQRVNLADSHGDSVNFPDGGVGLLKQTIQYNLGVHVDYYARVDFAGFMKIVDTLGGVDVIADCPVMDVFPDDPITEDPTVTGTISIETPGVYHLDGKHALWYARSRYTSPGGDLDRNRRQHRVLRGIWSKGTQLETLARLPVLWNELSSSIATDLKWDDIAWLASLAPRLDGSHIHSGFIDGTALRPWTTPGGAAVYVPNIKVMLEQVQETFNPPSNIASQAPIKVEVWNGTSNLDWDILATDRLTWEGYVVPSFRSADRQDYARTQIVDFTTVSKGSRLPALMELFKVAQADIIQQPDPDSPVAFRIIVGANYNPCTRPAMPYRPPPAPTSTPTALPDQSGP